MNTLAARRWQLQDVWKVSKYGSPQIAAVAGREQPTWGHRVKMEI